jgi:hypothetical protein
MAQHDPVNRSMLRMEVRRFQTRCEAQEGSIQRADSIREVAALAKISIPFPLTEEPEALDARAQIWRTADEKARELMEELLGRFLKAEPILRDKIKRQIQDEMLQLTGPLNGLRTWAQGKLTAAEQMLSYDS